VGIINYAAGKKLLTVARGHPYDREAFAVLFEGLEDYEVCHVEQPLAQRFLNPAGAREFDAIVCYDMPGVDFVSAPGSATPVVPPENVTGDFCAMLQQGVGMVFMHHALAAWPAWPEFAGIIGGRFHYRPADLGGRDWPDSGYRHKVRHRVSRLLDHPVTAGVPEHFEMTDELYLCPVFEDQVIPLLRSDYTFTDQHFFSAARAVGGEMNSREGWSHPPGSSLVGWLKAWGNSPIVYLQGGDDAEALRDPHFRTLVHNAVRWVGSEAAREWVAESREK
jgi:type 1 glutamine amidotransferase